MKRQSPILHYERAARPGGYAILLVGDGSADIGSQLLLGARADPPSLGSVLRGVMPRGPDGRPQERGARRFGDLSFRAD